MSKTATSKVLNVREDPHEQITDWVPVKEFCNRFPNIPEKSIRWQLTSRRQNGLSAYVQTIGSRLYISISGYAKWLNNNAKC